MCLNLYKLWPQRYYINVLLSVIFVQGLSGHHTHTGVVAFLFHKNLQNARSECFFVSFETDPFTYWEWKNYRYWVQGFQSPTMTGSLFDWFISLSDRAADNWAANLQREIPELSSIAPLLHRCNCCRMHPVIPYLCAICAGSSCRCNLLTLQGGLLPVRTAGRGVKIGSWLS